MIRFTYFSPRLETALTLHHSNKKIERFFTRVLKPEFAENQEEANGQDITINNKKQHVNG